MYSSSIGLKHSLELEYHLLVLALINFYTIIIWYKNVKYKHEIMSHV